MISVRSTLLGFLFAAAIFTTTSVLIAWTAPSSAPPNGNVSPPINTSTTDQVKSGGLSVDALAVFGNALISGASRYFNFGTVTGVNGYGFRDNAGVMEFKSSTGSWSQFLASAENGGLAVPTSASVTGCDTTTEGSQRYNATLKIMEFCNGTAWTAFGSGSAGSGTSYTINTNQNKLNLFVYASSPTVAATYTFTISPSVVIYSDTTGTPALQTGAFPAGSVVRIINNGSIIGMGGAGGSARASNSGAAGGAGGTALSLGMNVTIDNTNGLIAGGGGGGGGGGARNGAFSTDLGAAGGGGGRTGITNSAGGSGTQGNPNGAAGTISAAGNGGSASGIGNGGNGGNYGAAGGNGASVDHAGGAGGAAGKAILLNGKTITWLGGNDATHVKGAIQ